MATINKVTERKMNGVCSVAVLCIFDGNRKAQGSVFCVQPSHQTRSHFQFMRTIYTYASR